MSDIGTAPGRQADTEAQPQPAGQRPFKNILCAVNGTRRSFNAVEQAAVLAGPHGHLTLLAATAEAGSGAYRQAVISPVRAEHILERAAKIARDAGVPAETVLESSAPADVTIIERAASHDLLAIGAPAAAVAGVFTDGVAVSAQQSLSTPLLLSRPLPHGEDSFACHMLVASDGMDPSDDLVALAARLAPLHCAEVLLVHALGVESQSHPHRVEQQGGTLAAAMGTGVCRVVTEPGEAAEVVLETAEKHHVSLILAGARRPHGPQVLLGSVSHRLAHHAHASVLVLPPPASGS